MIEITLGAAFIAGLLTFLAPCTLPLIPAFIGYLGGIGGDDVGNKGRMIRAALGFVLGFTAVFVFFGAIAGLFGSFLFTLRPILTKIGGILVIIIGLLLIFGTNIPFLKGANGFNLPKKAGSFPAAFIAGASFGFGWSPCLGPILGGILTLAATSGNLVNALLLMFTFSIGLGLPFIGIAMFYERFSKYLLKISPKILQGIQVFGGVVFVAIGILLLTDSFHLLTIWGTDLLEDLYFDKIINYL